MKNCIFCYKSEYNSTNLKVCSICTAKFVVCGRDRLNKLATKHILTEEQSKFLGVRYVAQIPL